MTIATNRCLSRSGAHIFFLWKSGAIFVFIVIMLIGGCASTSDRPSDSEFLEYSFWPQFPAEPRVQFLTSYRYSSDIESKKSTLKDLIYGEDSGVLAINKPYGIEMFNGKIYVCDIRNPGVVVLDLVKQQTRVMTTRGLGGMAQPTDIAIAPDGMKYVADAVRGVVFAFDQNERHVRSFGHKGFKPVGIAVYQDNIYVCDFATQSVLVMDRSDGHIVRTIGEPGPDDGQFIRPLGIDVDDDGYVYVSDVIKCRLQRFAPNGELIHAVGQISDTAGSFVRPKHLAVDADKIVYIADAAFDNVQMFNEQGQVLMFFGSGGTHLGAMNLPAGITTSNDNIELFRKYIHPDFDVQKIVLVTNQFGPYKIGVYGVGQLREGKTVDDIASVISDISSGVKDEGETNPLTNDLPVMLDESPIDDEQSNTPSSP